MVGEGTNKIKTHGFFFEKNVFFFFFFLLILILLSMDPSLHGYLFP